MPEVAKYDLTIKRHSLMSAGAPDSWAVDLSLAHATLDEQIRSAFVPDDGLAVFMPFPIACRFNDSGEITFNVYASSDIGGARYRLRLWDGPAVIGTVFVTMPRSDSNLAELVVSVDAGDLALVFGAGGAYAFSAGGEPVWSAQDDARGCRHNAEREAGHSRRC